MHEDVAERYWTKVDRRGPDECWPWVAGKTSEGYGTFWLHGRHVKAHRVSWEMANDRPIPEGLHGLHECDNPPCVNPAHVWPGTDRDNRHDAMAKGRAVPPPSTKSDWCRRGHPLVDGNIHINSLGYRQCRTCLNASQLAYYKRNRNVKNPRT